MWQATVAMHYLVRELAGSGKPSQLWQNFAQLTIAAPSREIAPPSKSMAAGISKADPSKLIHRFISSLISWEKQSSFKWTHTEWFVALS
ncbi:hypothetical protein [Cupriavidus sp. CP313]